MVKSILRVFACVFSFAFSAYFTAAIFAMAAHPIGGALRASNHSGFAQVVEFLPFILGAVAGFYAARAGLRLEARRQSIR